MYTYVPPKPILLALGGTDGYELRVKAIDFINANRARGAEAGSEEEQSYGVLTELAVRKALGFPDKKSDDELGYDILLSTGVKVDVKCRGGILPFSEAYAGSQGIPREAKHNFFIRQFYDERLNPDMYLMTHLEYPKGSTLPGTPRERKWNLYVCGWVSKERAKNESIYLPRGSLTEQGMKWFPYRSEEAEFYHRHLNGLAKLEDLKIIDQNDIRDDNPNQKNLHLTSVDAYRIAVSLIGLGILPNSVLPTIRAEFKLENSVIPTVLHENQHFHLLRWLKAKGISNVSDKEIELLKKIMSEVPYNPQLR